MRMCISIFLVVVSSCSSGGESKQSASDTSNIEAHLLSLERKWLQYEFALDTASISTLLDPTFISISATGTSNKQMELQGIYKNITAMRSDSIVIDSFRIEESIVQRYDNAAIVTFICHTYKKDKDRPVQKRTKFYDVWINRNGNWRAASSQATMVEEIK